jgi:superfamily II DNA/RNA helicase
MTTEPAVTTFADLGVSNEIVATLSERGITEAFPIQTASIEAGLAGRDICGKAPTGSGKTLAFGIPAVDLCSMGTPWCPSVLILSPTRELATQIKDELEPLATAKDRTIITVFGGTSIERDIKRLEQGVDILVACPGRLEDLIARRCCELRNIELVVVDEADRMADMGFLPAVKRLLDQTPSNRHTLLFSATLDGDVDMLIKRYQNDPLTFEVEEQIGELGDVEHSWYLVQPVDRIPHAVAVLKRYESSIVFCRTRRGCDRVAKVFASKGLSASLSTATVASINENERWLTSPVAEHRSWSLLTSQRAASTSTMLRWSCTTTLPAATRTTSIVRVELAGRAKTAMSSRWWSKTRRRLHASYKKNWV